MRRVEKPWGHEIVWAETERYVAKILFIRQGQRLSRQYHRRKDETFFVELGEPIWAKKLSGKLVFSFDCKYNCFQSIQVLDVGVAQYISRYAQITKRAYRMSKAIITA